MNRTIMEAAGFGEELKAIDMGRCPICSKPIGKFRNALSKREFEISGMCQKCQDSVFGKDKPDPPTKVGLDGDIFVVDKPYQMFSGAGEATKFIYRKLVDKKGHVWLYPINSETPAEQVHFHDPKDLKSDGYGGSTLHFTLEDGTTYAAKGPWHSSSDAMYAATGVDVRNTSRTYGCVAKNRIYKHKPNSYSGVQEFHGIFHADTEPVIGSFNRLKKLGQEWADKLGHPVVVYSESKGGSSSGWEIPTGTDWRKDWDKWFKERPAL
jgi:hypothetical protein